MRYFLFAFILKLIFFIPNTSADEASNSILSMRERAEFIDNITNLRIKQLLPKLMIESNIDMWVVISREYNEDPIIKTLLPATWMSARRTTILVFALNDDHKVSAYAIAPYKVGSTFEKAWDKEKQPNQWLALADLMNKHNPESIGINQSKHWAHADGLVATDKENLTSHLPEKYRLKLVSAERLAVAWLEQRIPEEVEIYKHIVKIAHEIIAEAFSNKVIIPNKTTTEDVIWWLREKVRALRLQTWFHPSVSIQRRDTAMFDHESSFTNGYGEKVIIEGDLLHVDFGITYLRLNTDTQQHAYVLKSGEQTAPDYLKKALTSGNQLQDIFITKFAKGVTGNEVLKNARSSAISSGLKPTIYTHPLGFHGHGAGTTLGMWDSQGGVPGTGDYPLHLNTAYSIELNNAVYIEQWNKEIRIMLEEDAMFDESGIWYLNGRQTGLLLIEPKK